MDSTCPATVNLSSLRVQALTSDTLLDSTKTFLGLPSYMPNNTQTPTSSPLTNLPTYRIGTQAYTANIFSVLAYGTTTRYNLPTTQGEYWPSSRSQDLTTSELQRIYNEMVGKNVPGSTTTKIIQSQEDLARGLTGNLNDRKVSVSYDLLYSLQYEFCFWARIYRILIKDFITVQNTPTVETGFTQAKQTDELRKLINALNSVNLRMRDIISIAKYISDKQREGLGQMNTEVNQFYTSLQANTNRLLQQANELSSKDVESRLRTRMMEYSEEKNNYANNLLALYGFANLIALGLLFYIYKS